MSRSLKSVLTLSIICIVTAAVLAFVNALTLPIIEAAENDAANEALRVVYPDGEGFTEADLTQYENIPESVTAAYTTDDGGCVVKLTVTGYNSGMVIMCGVSPDGKIVGAKYVSGNETPNIGGVAAESYGENLGGATLDTVDSVDTVGGATKTTSAYRSAAKDALGTALIISGGSYDARSEEEIKLDEALPSAEGAFEVTFFAAEIDDLTKLYKASNGSGYVFVFGDEYIGTDESGEPVGNTDSEHAGVVKDALEKILGTTTETLSLDSYPDIPSNIVSLEITNDGAYIVTVTAKGYDANNKYSQTKKPITIKLAVTASAKIICCETVEQYETEGFGAACGDSSYYSQYNGRDSANYTEVDAISGATKTTNAYLAAVGKVLEFILSIEGGA